MTKRIASLLAGLTMTAALAATLPGSVTLAARPPYNPYRGLETASGQIGMVLGQNQFLLTLSNGDVLAINLNPRTRVTDEMTPGTAGSTGTTSPTTPTSSFGAFASGEYAVVHYRFAPTTGAVAVAVTLSSAPVATGKPHRLSGLVTEVGSGSFVLEGANGASFTVTLLPTTRLYTQQATATGSMGLSVGDFATALVRSGAGINDAVTVTYGTRPYGARTYGIFGTVTGVSGQELTLGLRNGASRTVHILPTATVTLNGQPSSLTALAADDTVHLIGSLFQNTFYAYEVEASTVVGNG